MYLSRPIPDKDYVEAYIKAFYLPENILEEWIIAHKVVKPAFAQFYGKYNMSYQTVKIVG